MAHAQHIGSRPPAQAEGSDDLRALREVPGVDAVYQSADGRVVYVVAREHGDVSWDRLLELEERLPGDVHLTVRAHQGRDPNAMGLGLLLAC
ncbi:MAG: hypothetical protein WDO69_22695 [Pseudomonadota bacterium]